MDRRRTGIALSLAPLSWMTAMALGLSLAACFEPPVLQAQEVHSHALKLTKAGTAPAPVQAGGGS